MSRNSSPFKWRHYAPDVILLCVRDDGGVGGGRAVEPGRFKELASLVELQ